MFTVLVLAATGLALAWMCLMAHSELVKAQKVAAEDRAAALKARTELENVLVACRDENSFLNSIRDANPKRNFDSMARRIIKIGEELGETNEAYLVSTTKLPTRKTKTYRDIREELIDTAIVALDCALTRMPDESDLSDDEITDEIMLVLSTKLKKWQDARLLATDVKK